MGSCPQIHNQEKRVVNVTALSGSGKETFASYSLLQNYTIQN